MSTKFENNYTTRFAEVVSRTLRRERFASRTAINLSLLEVDTLIEPLTDELIVRLNAHIYGEEMGTHTFQTPTTWWDHLKQDHAPGWFLKRYPVKYTKTTLRGTALFPEYLPPRDIGRDVVMIQELR